MADITITLTKTEAADLNTFFEFQLDSEASYLAAFTAEDPNNKIVYVNKYTKFLADSTITMRTIRVGEVIAGSIAKFVRGNDAEITYWIDKKFWGKGIATTALKELLKIEQSRPIYGRVAFDNYGSQRVLKKCGFLKVAEEAGYANARQVEIKEFIYKLL